MNITSPSTIPLSLYIHIPWCVKKCPYCDFNSHTLRDKLPESTYLDHLKQELTQKLRLIQNRCLHSIFIGGGTPSLISAKGYEQLLQHIQDHCNLAKDIEITLEANPGTVEQQRFYDYRQLGINRLSLGVQSLENKQLKKLGRIHDSEQALSAIASAQKAGFDNLNIDLMFGLSEQSIDHALDDLQQVINQQPRHISWYQLTLEPNTMFYRQPPSLPNDDLLWEMQSAGQHLLATSGYQNYEISAYSQTGYPCQHNLNYWLFGDYLGIGAGAHSKLSLDDGCITRHSNHRHPKRYLNADDKISHHKTLTEKERVLEFMLNALRLSQRIPATLFEQRTGIDFSRIQNTLAVAKAHRFLTSDAQHLQLTAHGKRYLNELLLLFVDD